jgi:hypothetical protein
MLRAIITKAAIRPATITARATFVTSARTMSEGDTGAPRRDGGGYVHHLAMSTH